MDLSSSTMFGLQCLDKIKCILQFKHEPLMNFKNLEKIRKMQYLKKMRKMRGE